MAEQLKGFPRGTKYSCTGPGNRGLKEPADTKAQKKFTPLHYSQQSIVSEQYSKQISGRRDV